jgi:two-component system, NarL family, nitrate/nitrite response regulator NarL
VDIVDAVIAVIIADSSALERAAVAAALAERGFSVVGTVNGVEELLPAVRGRAPDVVVLVDPLPLVEACVVLKAMSAPPRVVVVSDRRDEQAVLAVVEAGVDGFLPSDTTPDSLGETIRRVAGGEASIPGELLGALLRGLIQRRREEDAAMVLFNRLTRREREILRLLADGNDQDGIAGALHLSTNTARTHVQNVLRKLEVRSRVDAVALARRHEWFDRFGPSAGRPGGEGP